MTYKWENNPSLSIAASLWMQKVGEEAYSSTKRVEGPGASEETHVK